MTQITILECDKTQENTKHKRAKRPALSQQVTTMLQGTDKTVRQSQTRNTNNKKYPQKKHHLKAISKKITGGLKHVRRYQPHPYF